MDAVATSVHEFANANAVQDVSNNHGGATSFDVANFRDAMAQFDPGHIGPNQAQSSEPQSAPAQSAESSPWTGLEQVGEAALNLSDRAGQVRSEAFEALASKGDLSPGDMISLTVEVHKFSFHSQLSSNIANRSSQGVQELFRQQL